MNVTNYDPRDFNKEGRDALGFVGTKNDKTRRIDEAEESTVEITSVIDKLESEDNQKEEDTLKQGVRILYSDSGSVGAGSSGKSAPKWFYAFVMFLGLFALGISGYLIVQEQVTPAQAQVAPIPEEEDMFSAESEITYTGPEQHQIDWEAEFDKIEYDDPNNQGGIVAPSLGMYSEIVTTGAENGTLLLPEAPKGTYYNQTAEMGSDEGNSILAGHVNHRTVDQFSPWGLLHEAERGDLIGVRDHDGTIHVYESTEMNIHHRQALPDEYFRTDGDHELHLVTCSGEVTEDPDELGGRYFENNLVVSAKLVETID